MPMMMMADSPCEMFIIPDWNWAILTILQEARSEPLPGQIAVAEVIRNRMKWKYASNGTFRDTCLRPYQFSGWNTTDPNRIICAGFTWTSPLVTNAIRAFDKAFFNASDITEGAVLYHAISMEKYPAWTEDPRVIKTVDILRHRFYRQEGIGEVR